MWVAAVFALAGGMAVKAAEPLVLGPETAEWVSTNGLGIQAFAPKKEGRLGALRPVLIDALPVSEEFRLAGITTGGVDGLKTVRYEFRAEGPVYFEVFANRLGTSLDPLLRVVDKSGRELAVCDDDPFLGRDAALTFRPKEAGDYVLELRDVAHGSGFFALKATTKIPAARGAKADDEAEELMLPVVVEGGFNQPDDRDVFWFEVQKDARWIFATKTREMGSPCDPILVLRDEKGVVVAESIGSGPSAAAITNTFKSGGKFALEVREISRLGGAGYDYRLEIRKFEPGVVVSAEFADGKVKFTAQRFEYEGPITITAPGLESVTIAEKKNEAEFTPVVSEPQVVRFTAEAGGRSFPVTTGPALKKAYPLMMFPPAALDGFIVLNPASK